MKSIKIPRPRLHLRSHVEPLGAEAVDEARKAAGRPALGETRRAQKPPAAGKVLRSMDYVALLVIAVLIMLASAASFAESYRGLYDWALGHGLSGFWAAVWPLQVDVFIAVGELTLFVALVRAWRHWSRWPAWGVTLTGLAVSVAGNVGHVHSDLIATRVTAAIPPLAAMFALAVGLGVLKRIVAAMPRKETEDVSPGISPGVSVKAHANGDAPLPTYDDLQKRRGVSQSTARKIRAEIRRDRAARAVPVKEEVPS